MQKFNVKMLITYVMHNAVPRVWEGKNQTSTVICTAAIVLYRLRILVDFLKNIMCTSHF